VRNGFKKQGGHGRKKQYGSDIYQVVQ